MNEKPESIMEFNRVKDKFEKRIRELLQSTSTVLELEYTPVDNAVPVMSLASLERETVL